MLAFETYFYDHISILPAISSLACSSPLASLFILQGCLILFLLLPWHYFLSVHIIQPNCLFALASADYSFIFWTKIHLTL